MHSHIHRALTHAHSPTFIHSKQTFCRYCSDEKRGKASQKPSNKQAHNRQQTGKDKLNTCKQTSQNQTQIKQTNKQKAITNTHNASTKSKQSKQAKSKAKNNPKASKQTSQKQANVHQTNKQKNKQRHTQRQ